MSAEEPGPGSAREREVVVPARFNGPLESGQGGYSAGVFAALVGGQAEVDLRRPVPLDRPLAVADDDAGGVLLRDGEELIAEVRPAPPLTLEPPAPVGSEEAAAGARNYRGAATGIFSQCFVCGRGRQDSLAVFAGPVPGRELVASPWTPPRWCTGADGAVRPELVWSVLDCPTIFACFLGDERQPVAFLARFQAALRAPVMTGTEHVVVGWPLSRDGRKLRGGAAIFTAAGEVLAVAEALMVEPRPS